MPRPRPKPRPRALPPQESENSGGDKTPRTKRTVLSSSPTSESDSFFIKRSSTWGDVDKRVKRAKEAEINVGRGTTGSQVHSEAEELSSESEQPAPTSTYAKLKKLPVWTRSAKQSKQASFTIDISSDSESDVTPPKKSTEQDSLSTPRLKKVVRARSRSRSLTPPPTLSKVELQYTRLLAKATRPSTSTETNITTIDLTTQDDDDDALDPELCRIKAAVRQESLRADSVDPSPHNVELEEDDSQSSIVNLTVTWCSSATNASLVGVRQAMLIPYPRRKNLHKLFGTIASTLSIPTTSLALLHNSKRIYPGASLEVLNIWEKAELLACESSMVAQLQETQVVNATPPPDTQEMRRSPSVVSEADEQTEKIKVTIRSSSKEYAFRVTTTITCGELVQKFISKAGSSKSSSGTKRPALLFDGDQLSDTTTLVDLDIDDGDMMEIINL